jgi:hypothetical protein
MSTPVNITGPGREQVAKIVTGNALAVGPPSPSDTFNATLDVDNVAVEVVPGLANQSFCVTGLLVTGNKSISTTVDAIVTIFQATADDLTVSVKDMLVVPIARSSQTLATGILLEVPAGRFLMAKTTDDDVLVTILGFYV